MLSAFKYKQQDSTSCNFGRAKVISICETCTVALFFFAMLLTIILIAASDSIDYFARSQYALPHICLALLGAALFLVMAFLVFRLEKVNKKIDSYSVVLVVVVQLILCCVQIVSAHEVCFIGSWDSGGLFTAAWNMTHDWTGLPDAPLGWNEYFTPEWLDQYSSMYPNNRFLLGLLCGLLSLCSAIGFSNPSTCIFLLCVLNSLIILLSGLMLFMFLHKEYNAVSALIGWMFYFVLIGMSSWFLVPYSDSLALFFPIFILWLSPQLFSKRKANCYVALFCILLVSTIGYCIKPQSVFILFAVVLVLGLSWARRMIPQQSTMKSLIFRIVTATAVAICGIGTGLLLKEVVVSPVESELSIDVNAAFSPAHFFMMGLNDVSDGGFYADDVVFSESFSTNDERNKADIDRALSRVDDYGLLGTAMHLVKKQLVNWGDGSFAWGEEGGAAGFYSIIYSNDSTLYSDRVNSDLSGVDSIPYAIYKCIFQIVWIAVIIGMLPVFSGKKSRFFWICVLSIFCLMIFELMFEARSRYLYIYVPIMICLMVDNLYCSRFDSRITLAD